jgi:hypothetical protein
MSARRLAKREDWGQLGPAMRALPNDRWRKFCVAYCTQPSGYGAGANAARAAGFGRRSKPATLAAFVYKLTHDDRMIAAITEESKKIIRVAGPEAVNAAVQMVRNPEHPGHARMVQTLIDRIDPLETHSRHSIDVVHRVVDPDVEALEELRALRQLGTAREKLLELFGGNGLARIEKLEAADLARRSEAAKVIEHEPIEAEPEEVA